MEPEPPFLPGAGADPSRSEPESAPGPWRPGAGARAAQKSGGSATLQKTKKSTVAFMVCTKIRTNTVYIDQLFL